MSKEEELISAAMAIILHAGDARVLSDQAVDLAKTGKFTEVESAFKTAKEKITAAHQAQTKIIQDEARGVDYPLSLLFIHAQDTLMTIASEVRTTKTMLELFEITQTKSEE